MAGILARRRPQVYGDRTPRGQIVLDLPFARSPSIKDFSYANRVPTVNGNAAIIGANGLYLDGADDYLQFTDSSDWDFGASQDFSIVCDCIVESGGAGNLYGTVYSYRYTGTTFGWCLWYVQAETRFVFTYGNTGTTRIDKAIGPLQFGQISRIEVRRVYGTFQVFNNGVLTATWNDAGALRTSPTYFSVGRSLSYTDSYYKGYIRGLKVVKGGVPYAYPVDHSISVYGTSGVAQSPGLTPLVLPDSASLAALGGDDVSTIAAVIRARGVLAPTDAVDLSDIQAALTGIFVREGGDVASIVGRLVIAAAMSGTEAADLASAVGKITTYGALSATLSDDEFVALGRAWPTVYKLVSGITLSSPVSTLALSTESSTLGDFPPVVVTDVTVPDDMTTGTFPPIVESDLIYP